LDWRPLPDEIGRKAEIDQLLQEIRTSREQIRSALSTATEAAIAVRTGGDRVAGSTSRDYSGGTAGAAFTGALAAIPATTPAETTIAPAGFEELQRLRELPLSDVPLRVALHRAVYRGEYSPQAFRAMLASLSPGAARSLITGPRGG